MRLPVLRSHQRALAARGKHTGRNFARCFRFLIRDRSIAIMQLATVVQDNGPRENKTTEALAEAHTCVFDGKTGDVTAGNSSQVTDGAVALLAMTEERANELGFEPLGILTGYAYGRVATRRAWDLARCSPWHRPRRKRGLNVCRCRYYRTE